MFDELADESYKETEEEDFSTESDGRPEDDCSTKS